MPITAKINRLDPNIELPRYHSNEAAGFDIASNEDLVILPGQTRNVKTGLVIQAPEGHFLLLAARSSLPLKKGLTLANGVGIVDRDYCGPDDEIHITLYNFTDKQVELKKRERIAQGIFLPVSAASWVEADQIAKTSRGGFGKSGGYNIQINAQN